MRRVGCAAPFFGETLEAEIIYIYICIYSKELGAKVKREREREKGGEISNDITLACLEIRLLSFEEKERGKKKREERKEADVGRWLLTGREI